MSKYLDPKNDEFYTRYEDVEKELSMYDKSVWNNKTIFCNCDSAVDKNGIEGGTSAIAMYFLINFKKLNLKKLICTHYDGEIDLFNRGPRGYIFTKKGYITIGGDDCPICQDGFYNGSFDHEISLDLLKNEADIVCSNPPPSKAADYWQILINSGKKFLIVSNEACVKNDKYIPYFVNKKVWPGYNDLRWFKTPTRGLTRAAAFWFTNLKVKNRPKRKNLKIMPLKNIPEQYKKYDDSGTLLADNCYIPSGYKKPFAVSSAPILSGLLEMGYKIVQNTKYTPYIDGQKKSARVLVKKTQAD
jgi:hypothetical protein